MTTLNHVSRAAARVATILATVCITVAPQKDAVALTMNQFTTICAAHAGECSEHPLLQAYVGGALDLIAMLDEETDYLQSVYCKPTSTLFDVDAIIRYMTRHAEDYAQKNAMLLLIRYLEEQGGC